MTGAAADLSPLQKAALAIKELRGRLDAVERARREPIAIVGMACRFPGGANDPDAYWQLLAEGRDAVGPVPEDRWDVAEWYDPDPQAPRKMVCREGGFVTGIDRFDAGLFGLSPFEASGMDPQHRLLLQTSWRALEDAGIAPDGVAGSDTGVFIGISVSEYQTLARQRSGLQSNVLVGNGLSAAAGRIAYTLDFHGPTMSFDTACSSALSALHTACQFLRAGDCSMAVVGGANAMVDPESLVVLTKAGMVARDGRCKTFDAGGDGYGRGEGAGVVVLKRLSDAQRDGDRVHAVILGSALTHDGAGSGFTVPNGAAQAAALDKALRFAGVSPDEVDFVELHGTGTPIGDPIEVNALNAVYGKGRPADRPLRMGAVKSNVGHLESAAGMAGLLKVTLSLTHGALPPNLHLSARNQNIAWDRLPLVPVTALTPWPRSPDRRRVAGLSGFGFSGSNAHVILAEAPERLAVPLPAEQGAQLVVLSAADADALRRVAGQAAALLEAGTPLALAAPAFAVRKAQLDHRLALVAEDACSAAALLRQVENGTVVDGLGADGVRTGQRRGAAPAVVLAFPESLRLSGAEAAALMARAPAFADALRAADAARPGLLAALERGEMSPALVVALGAALGRLWDALGVVAETFAGDGLGALAAGVAAGALTLEQALAAADSDASPDLGREVRRRGESAPGEMTVEADGAGDVWGAVADVFVAGHRLRWRAVHGLTLPWVDLPGYPFSDTRHWLPDAPVEVPPEAASPWPGLDEALAGMAVDDRSARLLRGQLDGVTKTLRGVVDQQLAHLRLVASVPAAPEVAPWQAVALPDGLADADVAARWPSLAAAVPTGQGAQRVLVARDGADAVDILADDGRRRRHLWQAERPAEPPAVALLLPGLGEQYGNMARGLHERFPVVRDALDDCFDRLRPLLGEDLRARLFTDQAAEAAPKKLDLRAMMRGGAAASGPLDETRFAHTAIFAVEYAVAQALLDWGLRPDAILGYSLGEYVAACLAGVMDLDAALGLVVERARLIEGEPEGAMLAVPLGAAEVEPRLPEGAAVAIAATSRLTSVAGTPEAIAALEASLRADGVMARRVSARRAFHTPLIGGMAEAYRAAVAGVTLRAPRLRYVSTVTGTWVRDEEATDPDFWVRHSIGRVRFANGLDTLLAAGHRVFVEAGPGQSLTSFIHQHDGPPTEGRVLAVPAMRGAADAQEDPAVLLTAAARLWLAGVPLDWRDDRQGEGMQEDVA